MKADEAAELMDRDRESDQFKTRAAIVIAFFAMCLAITGLGGANAAKEAFNNNILASNYFSFFQAKNIRADVLPARRRRIGADGAEQSGAAGRDPEGRSRPRSTHYRKTIARYESEPETREGKKELLERARTHEEARDRALKQDPYFDYGEALLQIAIVLVSVGDRRQCGVAGVSRRRVGADRNAPEPQRLPAAGGGPGPVLRRTRVSSDLDAGLLDDVEIARGVGPDAVDEGLLADAGRFGSERIEALANAVVLQDPQHLLIQPIDDRLRRAGRREQRDPKRGIDGEALFGERRPAAGAKAGRCLGHQRQHLDLAGLEQRLRGRGRQRADRTSPAATATAAGAPPR